jgi:malonate-semialdehyde dehydrogenase (acetylating)/methylmalonate-semialdehyde dehydrogenase
MFRQALGVCVAITPFNFPVLNPTIFVAWSLICGNTIVVKPSEQDPLVSTRLFQIFAKADLPPGVVNVLHGGASVAQMLVAHRDVAAVSAIGSSSAAAGVYATAAAAGKRVQASGGASNPIVVMPDADVPYAVQSVLQAAFGMAGQRCLGASRLYTVGRIHDEVLDRLRLSAIKYVVGSGFDADTDVCPLISSQSKAAVERAIKLAVGSGAAPILDGRGALPSNQDLADGYFVGPTILDGPTDGRQPATDEVFGPVLRVFNVASLDEAISACNATDFGNAASIFTESGRAAREFKVRCAAGNIGINLGLAAPTPPFTMGGTGASFYGDLHPSGATMIDFYTDIKQVSSRWT